MSQELVPGSRADGMPPIGIFHHSISCLSTSSSLGLEAASRRTLVPSTESRTRRFPCGEESCSISPGGVAPGGVVVAPVRIGAFLPSCCTTSGVGLLIHIVQHRVLHFFALPPSRTVSATTSSFPPPGPFRQLHPLQDRFGNYIIQRALGLAEQSQHFIPLLKTVKAVLDKDGAMVCIRPKLLKRYPQLAAPGGFS